MKGGSSCCRQDLDMEKVEQVPVVILGLHIWFFLQLNKKLGAFWLLTFVFVTAAPRRKGICTICTVAVTPAFLYVTAHVIAGFGFLCPWCAPANPYLELPFPVLPCVKAHQSASFCRYCASIYLCIWLPFNLAPTTRLLISTLSTTSSGIDVDVPVLQVTTPKCKEIKK